MKVILINICLIFLCQNILAQSLKNDIKLIAESFKTTKSISFDVNVNIYAHLEDKEPDNKMTYRFEKNNKNLRIDQYNIVNFSNDRYQVFVNKSSKTMYITEMVEETKKERLEREKLQKEEGVTFVIQEDLMSVFEQSFDSLKIEYKGENNGLKTYVIKGQSQMQLKTEMVLDMKNNFIKSIKYFYGKDYEYSYINIQYNNLTYGASSLSESAFFYTNSKGEKMGNGAFKNYKIIY